MKPSKKNIAFSASEMQCSLSRVMRHAASESVNSKTPSAIGMETADIKSGHLTGGLKMVIRGCNKTIFEVRLK